jgi:hypothetical protein
MKFDDTPSTRLVDFHRMSVSRETMIFYLSFTIPLMILTYGCWWIWERRSNKVINKRLSRSRAHSRAHPVPLPTMEGILVK